MDIQSVLNKMKSEYEKAIITSTFGGKSYDNGAKAKEALIRSQRLINYLHEHVKEILINEGVSPKKIIPSLKKSSPELGLPGLYKSKKQDISVVPDSTIIPLIGKTAKKEDIEKILTVNVRSQLSSLNKNIDTLYERTFAEPLNLHLNYPKQCLGEVYLIPTHEYDDKAMKENKVVFKPITRIENYIKMFQAINDRTGIKDDPQKYERISLLIVDFQKSNPKLYSSSSELIKDGLLREESEVKLEKLAIDDFGKDILNIYSQRFDISLLK